MAALDGGGFGWRGAITVGHAGVERGDLRVLLPQTTRGGGVGVGRQRGHVDHGHVGHRMRLLGVRQRFVALVLLGSGFLPLQRHFVAAWPLSAAFRLSLQYTCSGNQS